ncbi:hypothetical protein KNP414_06266 [Paenibacillus mucilaginosus KNP414]|uniref:Uncharacterized protein n=1 Tax=Paenibacillus mucilaginosus (strain KNP414) TaxID=1036673 RepID=F8FKA7_PAEMK|nr:hypothetical protein KNP414_06266 [Paenibacillus mucilaginosus KNP414]
MQFKDVELIVHLIQLYKTHSGTYNLAVEGDEQGFKSIR